MCRLRNIAMRDYQESVADGQTDRRKKKLSLSGLETHACKLAKCELKFRFAS